MIRKTRYDGFCRTELDDYLRAQNIRYLLFTGVATNVCVESTARHAFFNEFWPILVEDAMNNSGPDFNRQATLWNFEHTLGWVTRSGEVLAALQTHALASAAGMSGPARGRLDDGCSPSPHRRHTRPTAEGARMSIRPVKRIVQSQPTMEGAGVKLHRAFGFGTTDRVRSVPAARRFPQRQPDDYRAGFPWHPHRGIETITYVLAGTVEHGDSLGNKGKMGAGDVQWMTAGSGILHQEMPQGDARGRMHGFQLWANLPSSLKMTAPRYQDIPADRDSRRSSTTTARACA